MKMGFLRTLTSLCALAVLLQGAGAANIPVGGPNGGWDQTTNLQSWASSQKFKVGDNLIFQYSQSHNVMEVTKSDYDSCQGNSPMQTYNDGSTVIPLTSPGKRYFICGTPGHCSGGMKFEVDTVAASVTPPTSSPKASPAPSLADSPISLETPASSPSEFRAGNEFPTGNVSPGSSKQGVSPSSANGGYLPLNIVLGLGFGIMMMAA